MVICSVHFLINDIDYNNFCFSTLHAFMVYDPAGVQCVTMETISIFVGYAILFSIPVLENFSIALLAVPCPRHFSRTVFI